MAWSASSGSTRSPRDDGNYMIGLALSSSSLLFPEFHKGRNKKQSHQLIVKDEIEEDELSDELSSPTQKKRRLTVDQVKFLETSFSMDIKLEPERKALLAEMLGIRPRQVAIWFQNRRARGKCKQLEWEFEQLKVAFETVMKETENLSLERESVLEENKRLQTEVSRLRNLLERMTNSKTSDTMGILFEGKSELTSRTNSKTSDTMGILFEGNSELTSRTKSGADQSDIQDSNQSYPVRQAAPGMEATISALSELNPGLLCSVNLKMDSEHTPVFPTDEYFGQPNFSLRCDPSYFEDTLLANYADYHFDGLTCHEHVGPSGD